MQNGRKSERFQNIIFFLVFCHWQQLKLGIQFDATILYCTKTIAKFEKIASDRKQLKFYVDENKTVAQTQKMK